MGYREYLMRLLAPMGVYKLDGGYGAGELAAIGSALDGACLETDSLLAEVFCQTAEDYGLTGYENLLPIVYLKDTVTERRNALLRLLQVDDTHITPECLEDTLAACGIPAKLTETDTKYTVIVHFTGIRGEPEQRVRDTAESILPVHINPVFTSPGVTWNRVEELFPTWDEFDGCGYTVFELLKLE